MCVVDPACHCILNWSLQMCICNYIERVQAPAPANPTSHNKPPCSVAYAPSVPVLLPWVPRGGLGQRGRLARTAVRPKPRFPVWRGRELCGGYPLEISSRRFCQAIPVVPPRPVSAAATEYRSTECPARTLAKSAGEHSAF